MLQKLHSRFLPLRCLRRSAGLGALSLAPALLLLSGGCHTGLFNSWLDPSAVGNFVDERTLEIRTSLSIQDSPTGIAGATDPTPEDLLPEAREYRFSAGDMVTVRIYELLAEDTETQVQAQVDNVGNIRLPILGTVPARGMTARELEGELVDLLDQKDVIRDAQVIVEPMVRRKATYTVFGATAGANLYPLPSPEFSLMQALSVAGGLDELVSEIYVFREESLPLAEIASEPSATQPATEAGPAIDEALEEPAREPEPAPAYLSAAYGDARLTAGDSGLAHRRADPPAGADPEPEPRQPESVPPLERERRELIESIVGPQSQPARTQPSASQPAQAEPVAAQPPQGEPIATQPAPPEPLATQPAEVQPVTSQSRWIFLNGKWIETKPAPPQPRAAEVAEREVVTQPAEGFPVPPEPAIDWSQIAEEEKRQRIIRVSASGLRNGDPRQNILIRPGDTIRLLAGQMGEYYMMGSINRPGAYNLSGRQLTFKGAVAAAGNLSPLAWPSRCTLYRRLGDREEMIQVDVDRIFAGQDPDFYIKRNDLIVFGTHPLSLFLAVARNAFRLTYGFGFVYDRNFADVDTQKRGIRVQQHTLQELQQATRFPGLLP